MKLRMQRKKRKKEEPMRSPMQTKLPKEGKRFKMNKIKKFLL